MVTTLQIALTIGLLIFLGTLLLLWGIFKKRIDLEERLKREAPPSSEESRMTAVTKRLEQVLIPIGEMLPRSVSEMSKQERRLAQAGIRRKEAAVLFLASHVVTAVVLLLIFSVTGHLYRQPVLTLLLAILGGAAIPDIWLKRKIELRKQKIQHALPDAMDLAVITVEAGLGLDQALNRVSEEIRLAHPELADELRLRNMEVNMGRNRADAFRNLADRTGVDDLRALVAILIQTDKFGTSIGQALRTFSESLRVKRLQRAEEMAAKLSVKMVVPMVLFIFPAIFIVVLGPAFIAIVRDLLPSLAGR